MSLHPLTIPLYVAAVALALAGAGVTAVAVIMAIATAMEVFTAIGLTRP